MKFDFVDAEKASFPVSLLCRELGVSRSGYYARQHRPEPKRNVEDQRLKLLVHEAHREGRRNYGRPKVHEALKKLGEHVSAKRVGRLMREEGLRAGSATSRTCAPRTGSSTWQRCWTCSRGPSSAGP